MPIEVGTSKIFINNEKIKEEILFLSIKIVRGRCTLET